MMKKTHDPMCMGKGDPETCTYCDPMVAWHQIVAEPHPTATAEKFAA